MANAKIQSLRFAKLDEISIFNPNDNLLKEFTTKNCTNIKVNVNPNFINSGKTNFNILKILCPTLRHFGRL